MPWMTLTASNPTPSHVSAVSSYPPHSSRLATRHSSASTHAGACVHKQNRVRPNTIPATHHTDASSTSSKHPLARPFRNISHPRSTEVKRKHHLSTLKTTSSIPTTIDKLQNCLSEYFGSRTLALPLSSVGTPPSFARHH